MGATSREIEVVAATQIVALAATLDDRTKAYASQSISEATRRAYATKWKAWCEHCDALEITSMPADPVTVANWLAHLADHGATSGRRAKSKSEGQSRSTLTVAVFAIKAAHAAAGLEFDTRHSAIRLTRRGIARANAEAPSQAEPMRAALVLDIIDGLVLADPIACRDAAILALGYVFARRRSELVGLDLDRLGDGDGILKRDVHAIEVVLVRHKTQDGSGSPKSFVVPRANNELAIAVIEQWLAMATVQPGDPILRRVHKGGRIGAERLTPTSVGNIVKARVAEHFIAKGVAADVAAEHAAGFSGHSLRVGLAVTSAEAGADVRQIQMALGHASPAMSIRYAAKAEALKTSPHNLPGVGLTRSTIDEG